MTLSTEFLFHARRLVLDQKAETNHSEIELRRAISGSYYAAWHAICAAIASKFHAALHPKLNRQPAHVGAKKAASMIESNGGNWLNGPCSDEMAGFCSNFLALQNLRLKADYDIEYQPRIHDAIDAYNRANRICRFISQESGECPFFDSFVLNCLEIKFKNRN